MLYESIPAVLVGMYLEFPLSVFTTFVILLMLLWFLKFSNLEIGIVDATFWLERLNHESTKFVIKYLRYVPT